MYEMSNYLARMMSPQQQQQPNAFASPTGQMAERYGALPNYQRFMSNMSPEDEQALFREMRAYQTRRSDPGGPLSFIYGSVPKGPGYATGDRGRDPMPYNYDLSNHELRGMDASTLTPPGDGMLGPVGRMARYKAFFTPRPTFNPNNR